MEDSFRVRVDKAFGSLASSSHSPSSTAASTLSSQWSLTDDEIQKREWNRSKGSPEPEPELFPSFFDDGARGSGKSPSSFRDELEDLEDLDEDEDVELRSRGASKPDDYDDEQWEIKSAIGRDCTLDYEEEEDQYDKRAVGKENSGDRLYMKDINDDGIDIDSCNVLPASFRDFVRDPRANHLAAKIRLKEDAEAAKKIDALQVSEKSAPGSDDTQGNTSLDGMNPKSILKRKDYPSESSKSLKRVRFDSEYDDRSNDESEGARDVRMKTSSMEKITASNHSSRTEEFASAVPDYIRNPSRYTHYTFDSEGDMDDNSNKQACMDFLSQLKRSKAATESQADDGLEDLPSVTFISKKKSGDATMVETDAMSKRNIEVGKELIHRRGMPLGIAAADTDNNDVCAMEEDEPEVIDDTKKSSQKLNRQYRRKPRELDEPIV